VLLVPVGTVRSRLHRAKARLAVLLRGEMATQRGNGDVDRKELEEILAEIGLEHRAIGAPDKLESVLCAATAARISVKAAPRMRLAFTLAAVVILLAALAGVAVLWQTHIGHSSQIQQARSASPVQRTPRQSIL